MTRYAVLTVAIVLTHVAAHPLVADPSSARFWVVRVGLLLPVLVGVRLLSGRRRREPADTRPGTGDDRS